MLKSLFEISTNKFTRFRNCHTKLDSMRAVIGSDGDALCESCHRAAADAERAARARSVPRHTSIIP